MMNHVPIFAPIRPSSLRQPSGPSSPVSPLTPPATNSCFHDPNRSRTPNPQYQVEDSDVSPRSAPPNPLPWVWSCHLCHSNYPLGATRRCLHDGHYLCAGNASNKRSGKAKKNKPCLSEFDYEGWNRWGRWRRNNTQDQKHVIYRGKDCSNHCDFPSHCQRQNVHIIENPTTEPVISQRANPAATFDHIVPAASIQSDPPALKRTGSTLERLIKAAEKRTSQIATLLSPVQEEHPQSESPPKQPPIPVPDFATFKARMDLVHDLSKKDQHHSNAHKPPFPPLLPTPFEFKQANPPPAKDEDEDDEPDLSPRRNAWDWTAEDIGLTRSPSWSYETFEEILRRCGE